MRCFTFIFCWYSSILIAAEPVDLAGDLEVAVKQHKVPAIAAVVIVDGEIFAHGAYGLRKRDTDTEVTINDKWHLGSCTKAMTATIAARLVKQGKIEWNSTLKDVFVGMPIHPQYQNATLQQLLSNTGGCPTEVPEEIWTKAWDAKGSARAQRISYIKEVLATAPAYPPGTDYEYSNTGFGIAGAMLERISGQSFESLMKKELFIPLGMTSAGFRAPARPRRIDQPYGHNPDPVDPEPYGDNPRAIAPAGAVHCSISDWAKFAQLHMFKNVPSEDSNKEYLSEDELKHLHTVVAKEDFYALGWGVGYQPWANSDVLNHTGSNTMFYSQIHIEAKAKFAILVTTNTGEEIGLEACEEAVKLLAKMYRDKSFFENQ